MDLVWRVFAFIGVTTTLAFGGVMALAWLTARSEARSRNKPLPDFNALTDEQWDRFFADLEAREERHGRPADVHDVFPEEGDR